MKRRQVLPMFAALLPIGSAASAGSFQREDFEKLLARLADGWNSGDARAAAACFTVNAVYVEPPRKQVYVGRKNLYRYFGADAGRAGAMSMTWRHTVFDAARGLGMGEFSFRYGTQVHGVAVIAIRDGLIAQWREYFYASELPFEEFVAPGAP